MGPIRADWLLTQARHCAWTITDIDISELSGLADTFPHIRWLLTDVQHGCSSTRLILLTASLFGHPSWDHHRRIIAAVNDRGSIDRAVTFSDTPGVIFDVSTRGRLLGLIDRFSPF